MKKTLSFEKDLTFQTMIGEVTTISFEEDLKFIDKSNVEGNFYISGKYKMTEASTLIEDFSFSVPIEIALLETYDLQTTKISVENFTYEVIDDNDLRCKIDILIEGREEIILESEEEKTPVEVRVKEETPEITEKTIEEENKKEEVKSYTLERDCDGDIINEEEKEIPIKKEKVEKEEQIIEEEQKVEDIKEKVEVKETIITKEREEQKEEVKEEIKEESKEEIKEEKREEEMKEKDSAKESSTIKVNSLFSNLGDDNDTFATYSVYIMRENDTIEKVMNDYQVKRDALEVYNDLSTIELNSKVIIPAKTDE